MPSPSTPDDLVIYPAELVRTMDPARPTAEAIAVSGDRIRAVGTVDELRGYRSDARVDDRYAGKVLLPGFVEAHSHAMTGSIWRRTYVGYFPRRDPDGRRHPGCTSVDAVIERLREADAALDDPDATLLAWGLDPVYFSGERLVGAHLDRVSSTRPIFVLHASAHLATVNSALMRRDGITRDSAVEGVMRRPDGEPDGELREPVAMALTPAYGASRLNGIDESALYDFARDARNHGATTLTDLGTPDLMDDAGVALFERAVTADDYPARLSVFHRDQGGGAVFTDPDAVVSRLTGLRDRSHPKLRFGHVKFVLDGSIQGFSARLQAPGYLGDRPNGIWVLGPDEFRSAFTAVHRGGLTVHVHCNGDQATELFLDVVQEALAAHPRWDHRHTVTHSQLSTPAQYRRMAALGLCANIFANHLHYWGDQHRDVILGVDRASRMNAAATALRCGVPISLHCDTPITPLHPLHTAQIAVTRRTATGRVLGADERITAGQALHAITLGGAHLLKMDHEIGSLEAGKYADLAVLGEDPLAVAEDAIADVPVHGTVVGGRHFPVPTAGPA
jgi:hypothetical protein